MTDTDLSNLGWDIDPIDKAWFITPKGELWSGISHRLILRNKFQDDWHNLCQRGATDDEIEETFTKRLLINGFIKIGELDEFYSQVDILLDEEKDLFLSFVRSILKSRDVGDKLLTIRQTWFLGKTMKYTLEDIANGILPRIRFPRFKIN